ncbi:NEP1-interacting protein 1-like isoform X1 [Phalaenopsis equestris]|uniref:NEP1-interacting protein 1-like isoform X1 n=1 Tax=Phalaenopsis equestris TaxID=78828 RepID=UPI0009E5452D|nr:NEP1-interacting protein 1-like isoform X1 [Phalaenopsis equestris]
MEFVSESPLLPSPPSDGAVGGGRSEGESFVVSEFIERLVVAIITCVFAIVGTPIGAVTGAVIGIATETGLFRGAGIGAISGAVFSVEAVESSVALWHSSDSGIWSILYVFDIICSLLSGRIVREKVGPAVLSAVQSQVPVELNLTELYKLYETLISILMNILSINFMQMSALESVYAEAPDIFETGGTRGMSKDSVESLPKLKMSSDNIMDCSGERICCSVCLQDIQVGETARSLPYCQHVFHLPCIDSWLFRHGSCPLCRRDM